MVSKEARNARTLFDGIAQSYGAPAAFLSLGQYGRWRRALVREIELAPGARALDVATGTGLIAADIQRRTGVRVIGLDANAQMLASARQRGRTGLIGGDAQTLPFPDDAFDAVTFSYLLRYVPDPAATMRELARVVRPGGILGSVEFGMPLQRLAGAGWRTYALHVVPALSRPLGRGWRAVGGFLGPSIVAWANEWPIERQVAAWQDAGVDVRTIKRMTLGAGVVMVGRRHAA